MVERGSTKQQIVIMDVGGPRIAGT